MTSLSTRMDALRDDFDAHVAATNARLSAMEARLAQAAGHRPGNSGGDAAAVGASSVPSSPVGGTALATAAPGGTSSSRAGSYGL